MKYPLLSLGQLTKIRTGKLDANAANENGAYPFFTCAVKPLLINTAAFDCKAVLVAGNGDLNVKYYEGKFNAYQRTYVIECLDESKLFPKYLYLFLDKYVAKLREQAIGGVIKYIKLENLSDAKIPLLPLADQKRIAEILDKASEIKAKREQAIAKLDELAQSTFFEMFGDVKNKVTLKSICDLITDGTHYTPTYADNGYVFLSAKNVTSRHIDWVNVKYIGEELHCELQKRVSPKLGDVLLAKNGTTGVAAIVNEDVIFDIYVSLALLRPSKNILTTYLHAALNSVEVKRQFNAALKGVGVPNLHLVEIRNALIPLPSLDEQKVFEVKLKKMNLMRTKIEEQYRDIATTIASLQHQAFTSGFNA